MKVSSIFRRKEEKLRVKRTMSDTATAAASSAAPAATTPAKGGKKKAAATTKKSKKAADHPKYSSMIKEALAALKVKKCLRSLYCFRRT